MPKIKHPKGYVSDCFLSRLQVDQAVKLDNILIPKTPEKQPAENQTIEQDVDHWI